MTGKAANVASTLARLRNIADAGGLSFNDVLQRYVIERFLARIARLPDADTVLLKGALMLRVWGLPRARPTMDIDLLRRGAADQATLRELVGRCAAVTDVGDVVEFDAATIAAEAITEEAEYVGTRIRLTARMGNVRQRVQIDFGVGDAVVPDPVRIEFPLILGGDPIRLTAYPVEAAIAEKLHVMVVRDLRNSRMKDLYDIWTLSRHCSFRSDQLRSAIQSTFQRRGTPLPAATPPALTEAFHGDPLHVAQWTAFVGRIGEPELESAFAKVLAEIERFIVPVIQPVTADRPNEVWRSGGPWMMADR
jgi:predicted nucleotidyltransferase component of viral defense system